MKDPLDDFNSSLRDLDSKLGKTFGPRNQPKNNHYYQKKEKLIDPQTKEAIIKTAKATKTTIEVLHKLATKNRIPKDYESIMEMRDNLELEAKRRKEIKEAIARIKELQKIKKEEKKLARQEKIAKLKSLIKKLSATNNNNNTEKLN